MFDALKWRGVGMKIPLKVRSGATNHREMGLRIFLLVLNVGNGWDWGLLG